ncbi:MAG: class I SAM-dependent methyltransferase [Burkholderiales bacterium]|nr:class I SAM-dependent methyltransferase [Burkholderiales bacterium]
MLGNLFRSLRASRPAPSRGEPAPAEDEPSRRYRVALEDWRADRTSEAVAGCKAALELAPGFLAAHSLLATIDLPGEDYFRVLSRVHAHLKPRTYVEIGVATGASIRMVGSGTRAIGVDPEPRIEFEPDPYVSIFAETSDDFFARHDVRAELGDLPIDLAFIDGMHRFEFALRDFMNIEALCTPSSTILIHDVYPLDECTAARERVTDFWSGDIWRLILLLRQHRPDLAVHTIGAAPTGLAMVRNLDPQSRYIRDHLGALVDEYLALDFSVLDGRKAERLALFPNDWSRISALLDTPPAAARR